MKNAVCVILSIAFAFMSACVVFAKDSDTPPSVSADSYILYCPDNGEVICSSNENKKIKPASTTKLMTTLLALEQAESCDQSVEFTDEMVAEGSSMYLKIGDVVALSDLAAGMMMASGNDAANAVALTLAKSTENFAKIMNSKAEQIGMHNTHFVTPSGLDDDNHYSTAYDMALLMSYALQNRNFAELTGRKSAVVSFIKPDDKQTTYTNHNRLLSLYKYCIGGKTGYTMTAGRCLVSASKKDGLTLICATFNDKNDWNDHIALYDYGFSQLACYDSADADFVADISCVGGDADTVTVAGEESQHIIASTDEVENISRKIYCDSFLYAPVNEGEQVGRIDYVINNKVVASTRLVATENVNSLKEYSNIFTKIKDLFTYG